MTRTDRMGVEVRERTMWDIRDGVVGADTFVPKHVVITTWKNVYFAGGIDNSLFTVSAKFFFASAMFSLASFNLFCLYFDDVTSSMFDKPSQPSAQFEKLQEMYFV